MIKFSFILLWVLSTSYLPPLFGWKNDGGAGLFGGQAWELNGSDERINVIDDNSLSFGDGSTDSDFSITAWIKMDDATAFRIFTKSADAPSTWEYMLITDGTDKLRMLTYDASSGARNEVQSNSTVTSDETSWIMVGMAYDGATETPVLYRNGSTFASTDISTGSYTAMENLASTVRIGSLGTSSHADGRIADVILWNAELTSGNMSDIYNLGVPRDERDESLSANIVSYWAAFNSDPTNTFDLVGTNDGIFVNMDLSNVVDDYPE